MSNYEVAYFSYCTGCSKSFEHYSDLDQDALLRNHKLVEGNVITKHVLKFVVSTHSISCDCYKTGLDGRQILIDKGVIVDKKHDIIQQMFQMGREEFSRSAKRIRLQREWKKELETNEIYKCLDCDQTFYQPLSDELDKICPSCEMNKFKRGALQESPKGMYDRKEIEDSLKGQYSEQDEVENDDSSSEGYPHRRARDDND